MPDFAAVPAQFTINVDGSVTPDVVAGSSIPEIFDDDPATLANYTPSGGNWTQTASGISVPSNQAGQFFLPINAFSPDLPFSGGSFWLRFNPATVRPGLGGTFPAYGIILHYLDANNWWGVELHWSAITTTSNADCGGIWIKAMVGGTLVTSLIAGSALSANDDYTPGQDFLLAGNFGPFYNLLSFWKWNLSAQAGATSPNPYTWGKENATGTQQPAELVMNANDGGMLSGNAVGGLGNYQTILAQHGAAPHFPKKNQGFYLTNPRAGDVIKQVVWRPWIP